MHCRTSFLELETGLCLKDIVKESNDSLESNHADVIVVYGTDFSRFIVKMLHKLLSQIKFYI